MAGCSTGKETYSPALICSEAITAAKRDITLQIFIPYADHDAIANARAGLYPVKAAVTNGEELPLGCFNTEAGHAIVGVTVGKSIDTVRVAALEHVLEATQLELHTTIENQETATQEQQAINEEGLSVNEEFQSTNEELLTSHDLQNVLYSTTGGTLVPDRNLKIRFCTPAIQTDFNVIPGDIGRPLADLRSIATDAMLLDDARHVLATDATIDREAIAPDQRWFVRRISPYRANDSRVEGVVITFADETERNQIAKAFEAAKQEAERANFAKSRVLAAASNDSRQPLQSLTLLQALLAETVLGEARDMLQRVPAHAAALVIAVDRDRDFAPVKKGKLESSRVTCVKSSARPALSEPRAGRIWIANPVRVVITWVQSFMSCFFWAGRGPQRAASAAF